MSLKRISIHCGQFVREQERFVLFGVLAQELLNFRPTR